MKKDTIMRGPIKSSFLSVEKDLETIIKKLFVESKPYSDDLKRLLVINTKDCLDTTNENYNKIIKEKTVANLVDEEYIRYTPKVELEEHAETKSYIFIDFDNYSLNDMNPEFRNNSLIIRVLCPIDYWDLGNYKIRPYKIIGYIDGILNNCKLSGIGELIFSSAYRVDLNSNLAGFTIEYDIIHGNDDRIEKNDW